MGSKINSSFDDHANMGAAICQDSHVLTFCERLIFDRHTIMPFGALRKAYPFFFLWIFNAVY
jgi:hypothetical protein